MIQFVPKKHILRSLVVAVLSIAIGGHGSAQDGRGQVHSILLNAEAVRTFDVLLEIEKSYDIVSQELETQTIYMRLTCDRDRQRLLCNAKVEFSQQTADDQPPIKRVATSGFLRDDDVIKVATQIGQVSIVKRPLANVLSNHGVPDLRFVGVRGFPSGFFDPEDPASFESMLKRILVSNSNYRLDSAKPQTDSIQLKVMTHEPPGGRVLGRSLEWNIATDTLMPQSYREYLRWQDSGTKRKTVTRWERFEWEDHAGVYVPSMIIGDELGSLNNQQFTIQHTAKIHWISVNKELEEEAFSIGSLQSLEKFQERIDLSLIDALAKES